MRIYGGTLNASGAPVVSLPPGTGLVDTSQAGAPWHRPLSPPTGNAWVLLGPLTVKTVWTFRRALVEFGPDADFTVAADGSAVAVDATAVQPWRSVPLEAGKGVWNDGLLGVNATLSLHAVDLRGSGTTHVFARAHFSSGAALAQPVVAIAAGGQVSGEASPLNVSLPTSLPGPAGTTVYLTERIGIANFTCGRSCSGVDTGGPANYVIAAHAKPLYRP